MARPRKEGMDYFPHDTDAVNDEKIEALRLLYGNDGYAFYFILLERIYRANDAELEVSDAETRQILARKIGITLEKFDQMLETSIRRGCFDREAYEENGVLTSNGIKKRAETVMSKRVKARKRYTEQEEEVSNPVSDAETEKEPRKVKESKEKKNSNTDSTFQRLYELYQSKEIVVHHKPTETMKRAVNARLKDFTEEQLVQAINNYSTVLKGHKFWFSHKYTFADLMREKDISKFVDAADPLNNFRKTGDFGSRHAEKAQPNYQRYIPDYSAGEN